MNPTRVFLPLAVAVALALTALASPASAQPATLPTWLVGQESAYGVNVPIGQELDPLVKQIKSDPTPYNITQINKLNVTGSLDSWVDQQVIAVTSTYYVLHTISASGLKLGVIINATFNNLPRAGSYSGSMVMGSCVPAAIQTTTGTVAVSVSLTALTTTDGTANYAVSNLAILNETTSAKVQIRATADLFNIPVPTTNATTCVTTVTYKNANLALTVDTQNLLRTLYSPAIDYFHFPISDGAIWSADSNATFGGNFTGTIDVQGLSSQDEQAFFANLTQALDSIPGLAVSGLDKFPIDLSQVSIVAGGVNIFKNGTLHDTPPYPIALRLRAKEGNLTLADGAFHEVFYIYPDTGTGGSCPASAEAAIYSPTYPAAGHGMIVGYAVITCLSGAVQPIFELASTPPATARGNIKNTETTYQVFPAAPGNPLADFFLQAPYWGILLVVAVVVVVVALLVMRRRRRPTVAPPPPPPPAP